MAVAPRRLGLTRDQFASFLQDFEQIKQFENLFATVDTINNVTLDDINIAAGNANATANEANDSIQRLLDSLDKEPVPANVSQLAVIETQLAALNVAPPASIGSVTSVAASGGTTGLTFTGSPITTSGTLTLGGTLAIANGGTGATTEAVARTNLGASTLGSNIFTITDPSAVTFPRFNADNTVSALDAASFRAAIGAGTGSGTVTSVAALTLGTTGTDLSSTVATGTTTPVITLNVPTASAANRGALSSSDWSTFNGKQAELVSGTNIKTINGTSVLGSGDISNFLAQNTQVFVAGTAATYTAPASCEWVKITVVGPGGNGGGATSQRATGGGGGAVAIKWVSMTAGQTLVYTVGTASGTASTVSSGTLVITTISAGSGANGASTAYALSQTAGAAGGTATGGNVNIPGGRGGYSFGSSTTVTTNFSGKGGDCPGFGVGGPALAMVATAGVAGTGYGAGGGGAHGSATTASGTGGIIIFEAY